MLLIMMVLSLWVTLCGGCIDLVSAGTGEMKKTLWFLFYVDRDDQGHGSLKT